LERHGWEFEVAHAVWDTRDHMAPRVLVCLEDSGVAHVIAARLMRDGLDGVVVNQAARLVDEARKGVAAVAVQHRYATGEIGSSLLRQVRVACGDVVPSVVIVTGELSGPDRLVYERQYRVSSFLASDSGAGPLADALAAACGVSRDIELHDDEARNEFDISIESQAVDLATAFAGAFDDDDDDDESVKTVEISRAELLRLKATVAPPALPPTAPQATLDDVADVSHLPAPGGGNDFDLSVSTSVGPASPSVPSASRIPPPVSADSSTPGGSASVDEGDTMQIQELQRTQAELKKALLAERKAREGAQKRVDELEQKLTKMGDAPSTTSQGGVPSEGVFEDLRYPALLARCRAEAFSGSLVMQAGGSTRTVFMKDGLPVAFSSSEPGQRIGKVLVAQGRITDEQYMKAATRMVEKSIKLTDALVELNLIDAESLSVEQRNLTRDQIIAGFEVVQGRFTTTAGAVPDASTPTFDFGPGEIYVQGYRRYAPANEMAAAYETLRDKYLVANARLASYRPKLGLLGDDERLLRLLGEALTVEEAVDRAGLSAEAASRLLAALQALDLVEEWSPGVEQFRSRLRAERQRHAEELASLNAENRAVQDRLLRAFEAALAGRGEAPALAAALGDRPGSTASAAVATVAPSVSPAVASATATTLPRSPSSTSVATRVEKPLERIADKVSDKQVKNTLNWTTEPTPPPARTEAPLTSLSSTLAAAASAPPVPPPPPPREDLTPAERKFREGVEQAAQDRLDEAEVTLREAVRLDATRPEFLTALARVLLGNPRYERSGTLPVVRSLLDRAVTLAPDHAEATALHKEVLAEMGG
jgi:hypothetical protein